MTERNHYTTEQDWKIRFCSYIQRVSDKPSGLWYSVGTAWFDWAKDNLWDESQSAHKRILYKLKIDKTNILVLNNYKAIIDFTKTYITCNNLPLKTIIWPLVAEKYAGIELNPYDRYYRYDTPCPEVDLFWLYGWDVSSGVIWDLSIIKEVQKVELISLPTA